MLRVIIMQVRKDLRKSSSTASCEKHGKSRLLRALPRLVLKIGKVGDCTACLGNLPCGFMAPTVKMLCLVCWALLVSGYVWCLLLLHSILLWRAWLSVLSYLSVGSGRLYLQSFVFATLDKPHSLSLLQSNCSSLADWVACNQLNCSDTGLEPQTECSALECMCCALRSGIPGSAGCAPAAQPRVPLAPLQSAASSSCRSLLAHLQPVE